MLRRRSTRTWPALIALTLVGCDDGRARRDPIATPAVIARSDAAAGAGAHDAAGARGPAGALDPALRARVCAGTCGGPMARIAIWRDARGAIARLVYDGDLQRCSHPPRLYLDGTGATTLTIPFEPVEPGSPKALEYQRSQAAELAGLTEDGELWCRP